MDIAAYVAALSADLSVLSRRSGLTTLAHLLEMARLEADTIVQTARGETSAPG